MLSSKQLGSKKDARRPLGFDRDDHPKEHHILRLYQAALGCFPEAYREEYADELIYAMRMSVADAEQHGQDALLRLAWRELRDLPLAILRAHLRDRISTMNLHPESSLPGGPVSGWKLAAVFLPFLLPLLYPLLFLLHANGTWLMIGPWAFLAMFLPLLGLFVLGLVRGAPVWALPALGVLFFFVSAFLQLITQAAVYMVLMQPLALLSGLLHGMAYVQGGWPEGLAAKISMMLLVQLLYLGVMIVAVAGLLLLIPRFRARVRQEWTLLSFLLYGIAILPVLGNDEFHGVEGYQIVSLLVLAAGAGLYLAVRWRWLRVLALIVPAILSPAIMSLGLYQAFPAQSWAIPSDLSFRLWEALQPVLYLFPLPVLLLLSSLAPKLPWGGGREPASSPEPDAPGQVNG